MSDQGLYVLLTFVVQCLRNHLDFQPLRSTFAPRATALLFEPVDGANPFSVYHLKRSL